MNDAERLERRRASKRRYNAKHREKARAMRRAWREANPTYQADRRREQRARLDEMKRAGGCVDCGTKVGRLDFDHRPGEDKCFDIAHSANRSWQTILAEVEKCDVRCVSCHARRHVLAGDSLGRGL